MKIIWDSQSEEPLFAIDEKTLYNHVVCESKSLGFELKMLQAGGIAAMFVMSGMAINKALSVENGLFYYITFSITFVVGSYLALNLWIRNKSKISFDDSIEGIIKKSISRVDSMAELSRSMTWWCFAPMFVVGGLHVYFEQTMKSLIGFSALLTIFVISRYLTRKDIQCRLQPERRSLQSLLSKLQEGVEK